MREVKLRARFMVALPVAGLLAGSVGACRERLPDDTRGLVRGRVFYAGKAHLAMAEPTLDVALFPRFPPAGPPVGLLSIERPEFGPEGVAYELRSLPRRDGLYLLAELRDRSTPERGPASGAYPTFCALSAPEGAVALTSTRTLEGIDFTIYDSSGALDPCLEVPIDPCPDPGRASLLLTLDAPNTATSAADALRYALFSSWPPAGPPDRFGSLAGGALELPHRFVERSIAPGDYAVYACYDTGSDNVTTLCQPPLDRLAVVNGGARLSFAADTITEITVNLETGSSTISATEPAGPRCADRPDAGVAPDAGGGPDDAGVSDAGNNTTRGALSVRFTANGLTPAAGDLLVVAIFTTPSPGGAPAGFTRASATAFPQTVVLSDIAPGAYYPFLCYDRNGDSLFCNGPGDIPAQYAGAPVSIEAGRTAEIEIPLD